MVVKSHTCTPNIGKLRPEKREFKANLGYLVRSCLKRRDKLGNGGGGKEGEQKGGRKGGRREKGPEGKEMEGMGQKVWTERDGRGGE